jgi:hypothetical protein
MEDSKSKAEALNQQFVSVFTEENMTNQPEYLLRIIVIYNFDVIHPVLILLSFIFV